VAIRAAGGLEYTHKKIDGFYRKTKSLIKSLDIGPEKKELLSSLLRRAAGVSA
jgi:hypothetical protein